MKRKMRKLFFLLLLITSAILGGLVYLVSTLIALLFETGLSSAIDPQQLVTQHGIDEQHRPIPKIIHQTWKNETIPEDWSIAQYACLDLHPDYQYIVSLMLGSRLTVVMDRCVESGIHQD